MDFAASIIAWYLKNRRELPWRGTKDPYKIWLSEIILQQTRVNQGLDYYQKFTEKYPTVNALASSGEEEVLKLWQGLGYYSRARNMLATARQICLEYGHFPSSYPDILSLKGVGPYTAAAIASFAFDLPHAVVDGNVYRVLSRYFGIDYPIDSTTGKKYFAELASELLPQKKSAEYNQGIMEFGALQCTPVNPACGECMLKNSCIAFSKQQVKVLPVKEKKTRVREIWFYYFVIRHKNFYYIKKRTGNSIWKSLYDFPLIESDKKNDRPILKEGLKMYGESVTGYEVFKKRFRHQLSHRTINAQFILTNVKQTKILQNDLVPVKWGTKPVQAIPRLIDLFLEDLFETQVKK